MSHASPGVLSAVQRSFVPRAVLRHKMLTMLIVAAGVGAMCLLTALSAKRYRSTSAVVIENFSKRESEGLQSTQEVTKSQRILAESLPVYQRTEAISGNKLSYLQDQPIGFETKVDGQLLYFNVADNDPEEAAKLANAWSQAFIEEMESRTNAPRAMLQKSLPELRREWLTKQEALNKFERESKFDPREFELHPIKRKYDDLSARLNVANVNIATLQAELEVLQSRTKTPRDILALRRATADASLQSHQRQIDELRARLLRIKEDFKPESEQVKAVEESMAKAEADLRAAALQVADQARVELDQQQNERGKLNALFTETAVAYDELKAKAAQHKLLNSEAVVSERMYTEFAQRKGESELTGQFDFAYARPWAEAQANLVPFSPNWKRNLLIGLVLSLMLAVGIACALEYLDETVRTTADMRQQLGLEVLGNIPRHPRRLPAQQSYALARDNASAPVIESLRRVQIGLEVTHLSQYPNRPLVITVTSALAGEGKSFVASNLATLFANTGRRVLVIDADGKGAALTKAFEAESSNGLREVLATGRWSVDYAVNGTTPGYKLLPLSTEGTEIPTWVNPEGLSRALAQMKAHFDVIIIDTPPVLERSDACVTGHFSEATLLVTRSRSTTLAQVEQAVLNLQAAKVHRVAGIVNGVDHADESSAPVVGNYPPQMQRSFGGHGVGISEQESVVYIPPSRRLNAVDEKVK